MHKFLALCALVALIAAQCSNVKYVTTEGGTCDATTNICKPELFCNSTTSRCQLYKVIGEACTLDSECANVGICSQGKCAAKNKNSGASCNINVECASSSCVGGICSTLSVGSSCANTTFCGSPSNDLYCAAGTCAAVATSGSACGVVATGKPFVQCAPGLYCVNSDSTKNTGTCQVSAAESAKCGDESSTFSGIYSAPGCTSSGRPLYCFLGKCSPITLIGVGSKCDLVSSIQGNSCDTSTSVCFNSVCTAYSSVTCNSTSDCGPAGICSCGSSSTTGTCQPDPIVARALSSCLSSSLRRIECQNTINGQNLPIVCADKIKAMRCCSRDFLVANKDLNLAYCSSATFTQISLVLAVIVAMLSW